MNKAEFIGELEKGLTKLWEPERAKIIVFYEESIADRVEDGMTEEEAVASLGTAEEIIKGVLIETPITELIQKKIKDNKEKSSNQVLWMVLAIVGFPVWIPLALGLFVVILAVYLVVWSLIVSIIAIEVSFVAIGIVGVLGGIATAFITGGITGLATIGAGLVGAGLAILLIKPLIWACRQLVGFTGAVLRRVKAVFVSRKEEV